jgi:hypothetical protein
MKYPRSLMKNPGKGHRAADAAPEQGDAGFYRTGSRSRRRQQQLAKEHLSQYP